MGGQPGTGGINLAPKSFQWDKGNSPNAAPEIIPKTSPHVPMAKCGDAQHRESERRRGHVGQSCQDAIWKT